MNWIYILVLCLSTYYIVARYLEKHIDNFDPSLVPVSSIVTLAKVAQKLVDGDGTLTNPGNLQIGKPGVGTTGNLRVTGTTTLDGATTVGGTLGVTGATTITGTLGVTGVTNIGGGYNTAMIITPRSSATGNLKNNGYQFFSDKGEKLQIYCNETGTEIFNLNNEGSAYFNSNLVSKGTTTMGINTWHLSTDKIKRLFFTNNADTYFGSNSNWCFQNQAGNIDVVTIDQTGNTVIKGTLSVSKHIVFANSAWSTSAGSNRLYFDTDNTYFGSPGGWIFQNKTGANVARVDNAGNLNLTGNILNKAAAFRVKFYAWGTFYMTVVNGGPTVSANKITTNNSDYWIECGNRLLSLETNLFLTHDGTNFSLEGMNASKRQIVMLLADVGSGSPVPGNRYVFRQLDSDNFGQGSGGIKYAGGSDSSYLGHNGGTALAMHAGGSGNTHFIKVA